MNVLRVVSVVSLLGGCAFGCNKAVPAKAPVANGGAGVLAGAGSDTPASALAGQEGGGVDSTGLHVSDDIAKLCNLPTPQSQASFAFDSSTIAKDDKDLLAALAKCLSEGPLRGNHIALTGRANPRGENEYNMGLGGARADSVRKYLRNLGVEDSRVNTTSRGELDADGKDEAGWARDRRVDINLAKTEGAPAKAAP